MRKVPVALVRFFSGVVALPVLALIRILRPWLRVRLLIVASHRFGHLALEPEMELAVQSSGLKKRPVTVDLWSFGSSRIQSNRYLVSLWAQRIRHPPSWVIGALIRGGDWVQGLALDQPSLSIHGPENRLDRQPRQCPQPADFTKWELESLESVGFDPRRPYVAIVVRDSSHYALRGETENPNYSVFNADLSTFVDASRYLVSKEIQVIRLGGPSHQHFPSSSGCFDYANSEVRTPELDVKLAMFCKFAVSTQTGPDAVALLGRRPVLYVDVLRFSQFFFGTRLATWCPMRIRDSDSQEFWSLGRLCTSDLIMAKSPDSFNRVGTEFVRSDPTHIREYVADFLDELSSPADSKTWVTRHRVNAKVQSAMGAAGRHKFGEIVAPVSRHWLESQGAWWLQM
jgi:putative glycosyltransferase (TIGR04372 family)